MRKYPVGIQSFESIRQDGYIYVDKTPLIYKMITEEELTTQPSPDIENLAHRIGQSFSETLTNLKRMYDGYHFSKALTDVYNPFSLFNAFDAADISNYWFESATPRALIDMLHQMPPLPRSTSEAMPTNTPSTVVPSPRSASPSAPRNGISPSGRLSNEKIVH